jgi:hypothetical protein
MYEKKNQKSASNFISQRIASIFFICFMKTGKETLAYLKNAMFKMLCNKIQE